jgi:hypothetical protein
MIRTRKSIATSAALLIIIAAALTTGGCMAVATNLAPSLDHCQDVIYKRKGNHFDVVFADCRIRL